jgi:hypothetical protein
MLIDTLQVFSARVQWKIRARVWLANVGRNIKDSAAASKELEYITWRKTTALWNEYISWEKAKENWLDWIFVTFYKVHECTKQKENKY